MAKNRSTAVDYLDISIAVPENLKPHFQEWLELFEDEFDYIVRPPRLKKGVLKINSSDLITFLGFIEPEVMTELESKRFLTDIQKTMQQLSNLTTSKEYHTHYQWCLTALKHFKWGRHREEGA